ncbi:MAG: hypothetical protein KatS3mg110_4129 [Pirellulaceae bacterium]|nr:MAG: hypothetical protein KatS3mg110_4129 [Pirellulaceae bacterium]
MRTTRALLGSLTACVVVSLLPYADAAAAELQAAAAIVDVTPVNLPVLVNGGMLSRTIDRVNTPVQARCLALSDGKETVVIVVVDSCMMPRALLDEVKQVASSQTGIPPDHMLISATHTHSAPASMGCLGTDADPGYVPYLKRRLVEAIVEVSKNLEPARIGFSRADAARYTATRRWIRRPDRIAEDPLGNLTVRANMHAARNPDDVTGQAGPEDPELSLIAVQSRDGRPLAVLANFSMHYYGDRDISADYFGRFCEQLKQRIAPDSRFVAIMSQGCSGDIWMRDYSLPVDQQLPTQSIDQYASELADIAWKAYQQASFQDDVQIRMLERRLPMRYRVPDKQRLEWARQIVQQMADRLPSNTTEVYAREQLFLNEWQQTEVVVQALCVGSIAIATTPCETYALTGLKIKAASPLPDTMVIELANGGDGYIPPPEQHLLGGYNTWPARSAGLEVTAEPRIAEACIELLEEVTGKTRRSLSVGEGPAATVLRRMQPFAWWRLEEMAGPIATDQTEHHRDAVYEPGVVFFLDGPADQAFSGALGTNRAAMFAGGRLRARLPSLTNRYSISIWIWNGMPVEARPVTGWFFSRAFDHGLQQYGDHVGVGGNAAHAGRLIYLAGRGKEKFVPGKTPIERWTWHHVCFVRDGTRVRIYLDGALEIETEAAESPSGVEQFFFGGRSDNEHNWEGRLDEIAVFDRVLTETDVRQLAATRHHP